MIDSSGRRILRANGTVFDLLPVGQALSITGALLVMLFTLAKPEASNGLDTPARIGFWALHVGLGLLALIIASQWLARGTALPGNTLAALLATGFAGLVLAAPGYLILDTVFASHIVDLDPDPPAASWPAALANEVLELAPWFLVAWVLINLPVLLPRPDNRLRLDDAVVHDTEAHHAADDVTRDRTLTSAPRLDRPMRFLSSLPGIVGADVVAVASDLHYLNVWTICGRTTVLGNLKDVVAELGDVGMQVHRSHWVAHAHVRRIVGTANDAACVLSNELRVPISRRRWKAVREHYGRGVVNTLR